MIKRIFKRNTHNVVFKALAGFGRSLNRLYENRNHDIRSNGELTILKKLSKLNPQIIIDAGANLGDYSMWTKQYCPNTKIYSLEPVKKTYDLLLNNVQKFNNIIPLQKGLYKENCKKNINLYSSNEHSSIYKAERLSNDIEGVVEIELIKGDDFLKTYNIVKIDLLKLDLEGAEYDALLGFEKSLKANKINLIQFEYGFINITTKKLLIDFYDLFESFGYRVGKIFPKNVEFRKYEFKHEDFIGPNFIAVNKNDNDLIKLLEQK